MVTLLKYPKHSFIKVVQSSSDIAIFVSSSCLLDQLVDIAVLLRYFGITCLMLNKYMIIVNSPTKAKVVLTRPDSFLVNRHMPIAQLHIA